MEKGKVAEEQMEVACGGAVLALNFLNFNFFSADRLIDQLTVWCIRFHIRRRSR